MAKKKILETEMVDSVAQNIFKALPLLRKRLLHMDAIQNEHGIPLSHVQVLTMLNETGSMSVGEISRRLGIAKPNITPLVDRLIETALVDRVRDTVDRRVVNVIILPAGQEKLAAIQATIAEQVQEWGQNVSAADFRELSDALSSITRILASSQQ